MQENEYGQATGDPVYNWQPASLPSQVDLRGRYCILEPLSLAKHAEKLYAALKPNTLEWTYLPYGPFNTYAEFCAHLSTLIAEHDTRLYSIIKTDSHLPCGIASYLRINPAHGVIEVGHLHYAKALQRTAAATEAMYLMMYQAFEKLGYRRYEWKCNVLNQASRAAAERLGFKLEGIFRQHAIFKQHSRDTAWFSIIDAEWPEIKSRLEKWLAPSNFDADDRQIQRLISIG